MQYNYNTRGNKNILIQQSQTTGRYLNPENISVPPGYQVEVFASGLDTPISLVFTGDGDLLIGDSGVYSGNPKVLRYRNGHFEIVADGFNPPLTGVNERFGDIYVSHKGVITVIKENGARIDIVKGLPSLGDFGNNAVAFGQEGKLYFGQGTATNSGVVGPDDQWVPIHPYFHDFPGSAIIANGINYESRNILTSAEERALTGAFSPFGVPIVQPFEMIKGITKASGSILRCNTDGSNLELVAWGFRNPVKIKGDQNGLLFITNQGYDVRGSRPIANAPDEFHLLEEGAWYGWPDYSGGELVADPRYAPEGMRPPLALLASIPSIPKTPIAIFPPDSNVMGFDFNYNPDFGPVGDAYVAKFGSLRFDPSGAIVRSGAGHRVTRVNVITGQISTFAINKSGFPALSPQEGGFGRPTDVAFGPDGAMYVSDYTGTILRDPDEILPGTGVIWRISRI